MKMAIIEIINDELKNNAQVEHSINWSYDDFMSINLEHWWHAVSSRRSLQLM